MIGGQVEQQLIDPIQVHEFFESFSKPTAEPVYLPTDFSDGQLERRMSLSATSDSASSKRFLTPEDDSPQPAKRARPATVSLDNGSYPGSDSESIDHAKVQLPSIFHAFGEPFRHDQSRRASLPTDARVKAGDHLNVPRGTYPPSPLNSYQFPPQQDPHVDQTGRPRVDTQVTLGTYADHSPYPTTATTSATPSSYYGTSPMSSESTSAPGTLGAPLSSQQMYGGATRIAGQADRRLSLAASSSTSDGQVKSEQWTFPSTEFTVSVASADAHQQSYSPNGPGSITLPAGGSPSSNPSRSPNMPNSASPVMVAQSSLVERAPRKRGKLPKHVTDYLKEWLHRHAEHPYPSEDEKKQLCHTTGLSMSQVSNWMINARRRILAPAQRAASAAAAASGTPYGGRGGSHTGQLIEAGRRASMPTSSMSDSMSLYHTSHGGLGGISPYAHPSSEYFAQGHRSMVAMPRSAYSVDPSYATHRLAYQPSSVGHPGGGSYLASGMPMSAPAAMSGASFAHGSYGGPVYAQSAPSYARDGGAARGGYYQPSGTPTPASNSSQTGSAYGTPQ